MGHQVQLAKRVFAAAAFFLCAFTIGAQSQSDTDLNSCKAIWQDIGLPELVHDANENEFTTICHKGYITHHNNIMRTPDWVVHRLSAKQVSGHHDRPNVKFKTESSAPEGKAATDADYTDSGFHRGHMAPSEDFNIDLDLMIDTFFLSNAVPQEGNGFNNGIWSSLERLLRKLTISRDELVIITGPIYQNRAGETQKVTAERNICRKEIDLPALAKQSICDTNDKDPQKKCKDGVAVPSALFKVIYDPRRRVANAYVFPNMNHSPLRKSHGTTAYLKKHRVTVDVLEELTGYNFFPNFTARQQRVLEEHCAATLLH